MADDNSLELQETVKRPKDVQVPANRKRLRTKLVDLFRKRVSNAANTEEHMKVFLRIKPPTGDEEKSQECLKVILDENAVLATVPDSSHAFKSSSKGLGKSSHKFTFSAIFDEDVQQAEFFNHTMLHMTKEFIGGQNILVFSYGVTSSGKTYTIQGKDQDAGILPRSLDVLFNSIHGKQISNPQLKPEMFTDIVKLTAEEVSAQQKIKRDTLKMGVVDDPTMMSLMGDQRSILSDTTMSNSSSVDEILATVANRDRENLTVDVEDKIRFGVWVSFAEIYNEQVFDLLVPVPRKKDGKRPTLRICDDRNGNPYIKGLKEIHVESADEAYKLLTIGQRNLQTACTRLNHCSSRSHCVFNIKIVRVVDTEDPHIACVSTLSLCDLAGSERYSKTQASGDRLKEAGNINTSLMTLGRCIETLRHNQLHREQHRLVPFRDSKLTRIFQNFFSGCGKAAMIVNVNQTEAMFDETLHVFKFSAIAKQVKYEEPPPEVKKPKKEKRAPAPPHRQTISWESQDDDALLREASNVPLVDDEYDEELELDENDSISNADRMREHIKALEVRNERLLDMLTDEMRNASQIESRVRQEVTANMQKQMVVIEEEYSAILKDAAEDAEELADERVKGIMEIYERRLERIQTKVDEDDEWVSSMLYYQEKTKVEEKDAKIKDLERQLKEKQKGTGNDSLEMGNSVLLETLSQKLQDANDENTSKDAQIEDLKSLMEEAGETYNANMQEIKVLKESLSKQEKSVANLEQQLLKAKEEVDSAQRDLKGKENEVEMTKEDFETKLKKKDATITSLEEECKELQGEIERLQDQMSQIDEQSRCHNESSLVSETNMQVKKSYNVSEVSVIERSKSTPLSSGKENVYASDVVNETDPKNMELCAEIATLKTELENRQTEIGALKRQVEDLKVSHASAVEELDTVNDNLSVCKRDQQETVKELKLKIELLEQRSKDLIEVQEEVKKLEINLQQLEEENKKLRDDNKFLEDSNVKLTDELRAVKEKYESLTVPEEAPSEISHMVRMIEIKTTPSKTSIIEGIDEENDNEVVFNVKPVGSVTPKMPTSATVPAKTPSSHESKCLELAVKLKDSELANTALRNKLKHEEEDFFKREQALIHGYTAEIDALKYDLAKFRSKVEHNASAKVPKKRKHMDISSHSSASESYFGYSDEKSYCQPKLQRLDGSPEITENVSILSHEISDLQQKLESLSSAYQRVERYAKPVKQETECEAGATKYSPDVSSLPRPSLTNSVLMFEKEEYAIKFEEVNNRVIQLEAEVRTLTQQLQEQTKAKTEAEQRCRNLSMTQDSANLEKVLGANEPMQSLADDLQQAQHACREAEGAIKVLESDLKDREVIIAQLQATFDNLKMKAEADAKLSEQKVHNLNSEVDNLSKKVAEISQERRIAQNDLDLSKDYLKASNNEKMALEKDAQEKAECLLSFQEKLAYAEKKLEDVNKELLKAQSDNTLIEEKYKNLEKTLLEREAHLQKTEENYCQRLHMLGEQLNSEGQTKMMTINSLQQQVDQTATLLHQKSQELERIENLRQEEAAEVAQKLVLLEREKRTAERRAAEAHAKEEEMELKFQGFEKLSQEVEHLRGELEKASCKLKEYQAMAAQELATKTEEIKQLRENEIAMISNNQTQTLKFKLEKVEERLEKELADKKTVLKDKEELLQKVEELNVELLESGKIMDQQDSALTSQDNDLKDMKLELESMNRTLTHRDQELANLKKQVSKAYEEIKDQEELKVQKRQLEVEIEISTQKVKETQAQLHTIKDQKEELAEKHKSVEKELRKQESINMRNKQEFEEWKVEKESCVQQLEKCITKITQEKRELKEEVENLKASNSDLAQEAVNIGRSKDAMIADLKTSNSTMSIQLANAQLQQPPTKMASPETSFPRQFIFEEDVSSSGHVEIDVTPGAAKKRKKRRVLSRSAEASTPVDPEVNTQAKCLRTIKEEAETESPGASSRKSPKSRLGGLASDVMATLSPLRRSSTKRQKKDKKSSMQPPPVACMDSSVDNPSEPVGTTRRSSRLKSQSSSSKHSLV